MPSSLVRRQQQRFLASSTIMLLALVSSSRRQLPMAAATATAAGAGAAPHAGASAFLLLGARPFSSSSSSSSGPSPAVAAAKRRQLLRRRLAKGAAMDPTAPLAGSVKLYDRHVVVLDPVRGHTRWPTHLEESGFFQVQHYAQARKALLATADRPYYALKFTVAEALGHPWAAPTDGEDPAATYPDLHSILVFGAPRATGLAVRGVRRGDVAALVEALSTAEDYERELTTGPLGSHVTVQPLAGHDVLVCAHASRDARCAACGPALVEALREQAKDKEIRVWPSSHVGGHRYAGNALVLSGGGDWYGDLKAEESAPALGALVEGLDDQGTRFAGPLRAHWRGCRGLDEVQQEAAVLASSASSGAAGAGTEAGGR